ncbi:11461_t:CDS:2, partial [Ambispora leptoticha]
PGNLVDYLLAHPTTKSNSIVQIDTLWSVIIDGLSDVWPPTRTSLGGVSLGDVWPCDVLKSSSKDSQGDEDESERLVPFHKLSQWLTYSLMEPMTKILDIKFEGVENLTGLPEYRNGGLFVDTGLLTLKEADRARGISYFKQNFPESNDNDEIVPLFEASDPVIIEWRAMTVILLDKVAEKIREILAENLTLAQVLEAGTWKAGRETAQKLRPKTKGPPISIKSDGT